MYHCLLMYSYIRHFIQPQFRIILRHDLNVIDRIQIFFSGNCRNRQDCIVIISRTCYDQNRSCLKTVSMQLIIKKWDHRSYISCLS